jgi:hypothetical protein
VKPLHKIIERGESKLAEEEEKQLVKQQDGKWTDEKVKVVINMIMDLSHSFIA